MYFTKWLDEVDEGDFNEIGKKCANLGAMTKNGLPVPPGFVLSIEAYRRFLEESELRPEIGALLGNAEVNVEKGKDREELSKHVRAIIDNAVMPEDVAQEIREKYSILEDEIGVANFPVSVRSSGAVSMPGTYETCLWVRGADEVVEKVKRVWSSCFNARSLVHRMQKGMEVADAGIGVGIVKMVNARAAGVLFTINPVTGDRSKMLVEANYGLGESVVSGEVGPDRFRINRITEEIEERELGGKEQECIPDMGAKGAKFFPIDETRRQEYCLTDEDVKRLVILGKTVEAVFGKVPQDIEWAFDQDLSEPEDLLILQARPEKTYQERKKHLDEEKAKGDQGAMDYITTLLSGGVELEH